MSHLCEHKFRHDFQDTLNRFCSCRENIETTTHYLLHCPNYLNERMTVLNNLQNVKENILDRNCSRLSEILLFGDSSFNDAKNTSILNTTIQYIFDTKKFDVPLTISWKLLLWKFFIYCGVSSMNRGYLILIRLFLVSLYFNFHFL